MRVERDRRGHGQALGRVPYEERDQRQRADVRREVEVALIPDETEVVEEPHEGRAHQEHEGEIREVVERRVVDHRPEEHRRVQVIGDVGVHSGEELSGGLLDHESSVVDVRVRLAGLAEDDRGQRGDDHERRDERGEVRQAGARGERSARAAVSERIGEGERAAGDEEGGVGTGREELPKRDVMRRGHRGVVGEE